MLFRDKLILSMNLTHLERAQAIARDFRSCTRTIRIGQALYTAHGPMGARSFGELGMHELILDLQIGGRPWEIWAAVSEAANIRSVSAITVQTTSGFAGLKAAKSAAEAGSAVNHSSRRLYVIGCLVPVNTDNNTVLNENSEEDRRRYVARMAEMCLNSGIDGLMVDYDDLRYAHKHVPDLPLLANSRKPIRTYGALTPENQRTLPGIRQVLTAGAEHALLDAALLDSEDTEWAADSLAKELTE